MRLAAVLTALALALLGPAPTAVAAPTPDGDLTTPATKEIAMQLVSSAENSSLDWRAQYAYIEDIRDGRGYTAGTIGFTSGTGDMLELVEAYTAAQPGNALAPYLPALGKVNGTDSRKGLGKPFVKAWRTAAADPVFQQTQDAERDRLYFDPAVALAKADGLGALGQFAYYDAAVVHGYRGLKQIRKRALKRADTVTEGGSEKKWLKRFLAERVVEMKKEDVHAEQLDRITKTQLASLKQGNYALTPPLKWTVNQTKFRID